MKPRQVPIFLYWRVENVQFWINSIGHLGWLSCILNFRRFHKNVNSLELWKYISENSSPKGSFDAIKENPNFPHCRRILDIYWQWLLILFARENVAFNTKQDLLFHIDNTLMVESYVLPNRKSPNFDYLKSRQMQGFTNIQNNLKWAWPLTQGTQAGRN